MRIAFIGVGVMGRGMVNNLLKAGHELHVYSRRKESAEEVLKNGAVWHDSVQDCVKGAPVVITIVGYPRDVEDVYFGERGIIENAERGAMLIDMTTTAPSLSQKIYERAKAKGLYALDAPVSGGDSGARAGTLTVMAGGDQAVFDRMLPVFSAVGKNIHYEGAAGFGQHTKMANQIAIAGAVAAVAEAIVYARKAGLDERKMVETIASGAAGSWQLSNNGVKMLRSDYAPGFFIKHFIKDMAIADEEAKARAQELPVLEKVLNMYLDLEKAGHGDEGTQAIIKAYEE